MAPPTGSTSNATPPVPPFVPAAEKYTVGGVILKFFEERGKDVAKALGSIGNWAGQAVSGLPPEVKTFTTLTGDVKNFLSATEVPKKVSEVWDAAKGLWTDVTDVSGSWTKVGTSARKMIKNTAALTNALFDTVSLGGKFIPVDAKVMTPLTGINFVATAVGSGLDTVEQAEGLAKAKESEIQKKTLHMINIARNVSYFAIGVLGLFFLISATPVIPWLLAACATSGLLFTIGGYFYEKLYDPDHKGKDLDPAIVIKNRIEQENYNQRLARG